VKLEDKVVLAGALGTVAGLALLIPRIAKAKIAEYSVVLLAEPEQVELKVDENKLNTPKLIELSEGKHHFIAPKISLNLLTKYEFYAWIVNGKVASYKPETDLEISGDTAIKALYIFAGKYPEFIVLI